VRALLYLVDIPWYGVNIWLSLYLEYRRH